MAEPAWRVAVGLLVVAYGVLLVLQLTSPTPFVSGDAGSIVEAAERARFIYDTGYREPLQPFLIDLISWNSPTVWHVRVVCAVSSLASLLVLLLLSRKKLGMVGAGLSGLLWMINPQVAMYAAQGDRLTLVAGLLFCYGYLLYEMPRCGLRMFLLALTGAMLPLARSETAFIVVVASCARLAVYRKEIQEIRQVAGSLLIALILFAPYPATEWIRTGDPFAGSSLHARSWANREFAGTPRGLHQSLKEVHTDEYRGGPLSAAKYILGMHSVPEIVSRYVLGYFRLVTAYLPQYAVAAPFLYFLTLWGVVATWRRGASEPMFVLLCHFPFAFIYTIDQVWPGSGVEARFTLQTSLFISVWTAAGILSAARAVGRIGKPVTDRS